jgi:acetamidase/formamidase
MTDHQLDPTPATTVQVFSRDVPPVLTVEPGDTVLLRSLDAAGHLERQQAALALASPVLDLRVTQVANQSWGVHALLPTGAIS